MTGHQDFSGKSLFFRSLPLISAISGLRKPDSRDFLDRASGFLRKIAVFRNMPLGTRCHDAPCFVDLNQKLALGPRPPRGRGGPRPRRPVPGTGGGGGPSGSRRFPEPFPSPGDGPISRGGGGAVQQPQPGEPAERRGEPARERVDTSQDRSGVQPCGAPGAKLQQMAASPGPPPAGPRPAGGPRGSGPSRVRQGGGHAAGEGRREGGRKGRHN